MTKELKSGSTAANLFMPVKGQQGSNGRFDARAHAHSPEVWLSSIADGSFRFPWPPLASGNAAYLTNKSVA